MKKLKKGLSLLLVLAMVFSLASTAFAWETEYKDNDEITQKEAVAVMTGMGIIEGNENTGLFEPDGQFTREQAAKIITYMVLGPDAAEGLTATKSGFSDVAASRWSAPYIAYAKALNIIEGYGNGKFGPSDNLSRAAWLKMLLVSLGVDPAKNGMGDDANWDVNAQALAIRTGLITADELKLDWNRETAVLYAFKAMKADMTGKFAQELVNDKDNNTNITIKHYVPKLGTATYKVDEFGRPGLEYNNTLTKEAKVVYATSALTPVVTYTTAVDAKDVRKALGLPTTSDGQLTADDINSVTVDGASAAKTIVATTDKIGGNGTLVEFYVHYSDVGVSDNTFDVVIINTYVTKLGKATKDLDQNDVYTFSPDNGTTTLTIPVGDFQKDDIISYNVGVNAKSEKVVLNATKLEGVSGLVTAVDPSETPTYVKVDGEKKEYAANADGDAATADAAETWTYYYDQYGYILYGAERAAATNVEGYVYVVSVQGSNGNKPGDLYNETVTAEATAKAKIVDATGAVSVVDVAVAQDTKGNWYYANRYGEPSSTAVTDDKAVKTDLFNGTQGYVLVDGKYVFVGIPSGDEIDASYGLTLDKNDTTVSFHSNDYYTTSATKVNVVKVALNQANDDVISASATVITGNANFVNETYGGSKNGQTGAVVANNKGVISQVVVFDTSDAEPETTLAVYAGEGDKTAKGQSYNFLINGEVKSLYLLADSDESGYNSDAAMNEFIVDSTGALAEGVDKGSVFELKYDEATMTLTTIELVDETSYQADAASWLQNEEIDVIDGTASINGYPISKGVVVYTTNKTDALDASKYQVGTLADVNVGDVTQVYCNDSGEVAIIVVGAGTVSFGV
jgi:hypothetical protein